MGMKRILTIAALVLVPGGFVIGIPVAISVWTYRRLFARNRVTVVHAKPCPILRVMKGGRA